jgi:hypothetical protein
MPGKAVSSPQTAHLVIKADVLLLALHAAPRGRHPLARRHGVVPRPPLVQRLAGGNFIIPAP